MLELKQQQIGKYLITETYGIITRTYCTRCGKNLPYLEWDCPNCDKSEDRTGLEE